MVQIKTIYGDVLFTLKDADTLVGADLSWLTLSDADFRGADLRNVNFTDSELDGADFTGANLENADLSGCILCDAIFDNTNLIGTSMFGVKVELTRRHIFG